MKILYLGYWNLDDPLTQSTIFPHLKILKDFNEVEKIDLVTIQREKPSSKRVQQLELLGVQYYPFLSRKYFFNILTKLMDFVVMPKKIKRLSKELDVDLIIARGAPAGALAYLALKSRTIPYFVESFEPHANYMRFSKTWKVIDPRYIFQCIWEKKQKREARGLIVVSENYKEQLISEGVDSSKIFTAPCAVDMNLFIPNLIERKELREKLKIPKNATVGVYAGKFGGLYFEEEAFIVFKHCFQEFKHFFLLLLSNQDKNWVENQCSKIGIPKSKVIQKFVSFEEVPKYLNVADFAFALYKSTKVASFLSPVKIGEYWSCGLPVLLSEGVGDESKFIESKKGGANFSLNQEGSVRHAIQLIFSLLEETELRNNLRSLALEKRSFDKVQESYKWLLSQC